MLLPQARLKLYLWGIAPVVSEAVVALVGLVISAVTDDRGLQCRVRLALGGIGVGSRSAEQTVVSGPVPNEEISLRCHCRYTAIFEGLRTIVV